jgi:SAM-dependent methyltransferase
MGIFRQSGSPHHTGLAMIGARAGDSVLILGASDPDFCAEIAHVTGLNGRTLVADPSPEAAARLEDAGGRAGSLVESLVTPLHRLPANLPPFDVAIVTGALAEVPEAERPGLVLSAVGALRPGGRLILVDGQRRFGLLAGLRGGIAPLPESDIRRLMDTTGSKAIRSLAIVDGIAYWEGRH